jgi:hypothetical protein
MKHLPVISVDTKSRELLGAFPQSGCKWSQEPIKVLDHDFPYENASFEGASSNHPLCGVVGDHEYPAQPTVFDQLKIQLTKWYQSNTIDACPEKLDN